MLILIENCSLMICMTKMTAAFTGELQTECIHETGARLTTYAPKEVGGLGQGFSPTDLVVVALGTCMLSLLSIQAKKLGLEVKGTTLEMEKEMASQPSRRIGKIIIRLRCPHTFSQPIREKLQKAVLECPVHHSLHPDVKKEIEFIWGL